MNARLAMPLPRIFAIALMCGATLPAAAADWPDGNRLAVNLSFDVDGESLWWDDPERQIV